MGSLLRLLTTVGTKVEHSKDERERSEKATWAPVVVKEDGMRMKGVLCRHPLVFRWPTSTLTVGTPSPIQTTMSFVVFTKATCRVVVKASDLPPLVPSTEDLGTSLSAPPGSGSAAAAAFLLSRSCSFCFVRTC